MAVTVGSKAISDLYVGGVRARGMYVGNKLVWPPKMSYNTNFKFGQTSTTNLSSASGGAFTNVNDGTVGLQVTADGFIYPTSATTDGTYTPYAYLTQQFNKYEISASVTVAGDLKDDLSGIVIGRPMSGENYTTLEFKKGSCWILNGTGRSWRTGWNITSSVTPVNGDVITLSREWSGSNTRYRVLVNGVEKANVVGSTYAASDANRNVAGIFVQHRRQSSTIYWGMGLFRFKAYTF